MARKSRIIGTYGSETAEEYVVAAALSERYSPVSANDLIEDVARLLKGYDPEDSFVKRFHSSPFHYVQSGLNKLEKEGYVRSRALVYELTPEGAQWLKPLFEDGYLVGG